MSKKRFRFCFYCQFSLCVLVGFCSIDHNKDPLFFQIVWVSKKVHFVLASVLRLIRKTSINLNVMSLFCLFSLLVQCRHWRVCGNFVYILSKKKTFGKPLVLHESETLGFSFSWAGTCALMFGFIVDMSGNLFVDLSNKVINHHLKTFLVFFEWFRLRYAQLFDQAFRKLLENYFWKSTTEKKSILLFVAILFKLVNFILCNVCIVDTSFMFVIQQHQYNLHLACFVTDFSLSPSTHTHTQPNILSQSLPVQIYVLFDYNPHWCVSMDILHVRNCFEFTLFLFSTFVFIIVLTIFFFNLIF